MNGDEKAPFGLGNVFIQIDGGEPVEVSAGTIEIEKAEQPERAEALAYSGSITLSENVKTPFRMLSDHMRRHFKAITWDGKIYW